MVRHTTYLAALRDRYPQVRIPNPVSEILMCPPLKVLIQMIQVASNSIDNGLDLKQRILTNLDTCYH